MQQEVYADLYFLINTSMNLLCLMITASLLHRSVKRWRAILGAAVGGAYAVLALLFGVGGVVGLLADCALGFVMCAITFAAKKTSVPHLLKCTAVQVLTSMLLGGIMTGLYSLLNRLHLPWEALEGDGLSVWTFALLTAVASLATVRGGRFLGLSKHTKSVTVRAKLFDTDVTLRAMVDSGNLLRDPLSGRSVIVAERRLILATLPSHLAEALKSNDPTKWLSDKDSASYIRLIPTKTATGETLLPAFVPRWLEIDDGKNTYSADYLLAPGDLGKSANGFDAVIPGE